MNPLDRPIWTALTTRQSKFARGRGKALAFRSDVEPFAASPVDDPDSMAALGKLLIPEDFLLLIQSTPSPTPPGLQIVREAVGVQMIAGARLEAARPPDAVLLDDSNAAEMVELAELTKPGPFRAATHRLGRFWGIRKDGRLVAMAGERLKLPGLTEVSGVCTHPDWRGHGFGGLLSAFVARLIQDRGEVPFLHAYADNQQAISLYQKLGFRIRTEMAVQAFAGIPMGPK